MTSLLQGEAPPSPSLSAVAVNFAKTCVRCLTNDQVMDGSLSRDVKQGCVWVGVLSDGWCGLGKVT